VIIALFKLSTSRSSEARGAEAIALRLLSKKARKVERQSAQGLGLPKTASIGVLPLRDRALYSYLPADRAKLAARGNRASVIV